MTKEFIQKCLDDAEALNSKLPNEISQKDGMSSQKIRHFLNNLCSGSDIRYLNAGLCSGSSFWSAIYENSITATGIDLFRNYVTKVTERDFYRNLSDVINLENGSFDRTVEILVQDCFTVELKRKYNIYFYDADHSEESQYKALTYFDKYLDDEFVLIVDDYDDIYVKRGTERAIKDIGYNVVFSQEKRGQFGNWNPKSDTWWNGLLVCLIKKNAT